VTPLRFANPSPPSGWIEDFHLQAVVHTRHTTRRPPESGPSVALIEVVDQAKRNDARAPKAIFPLLFAFAETYKPA